MCGREYSLIAGAAVNGCCPLESNLTVSTKIKHIHSCNIARPHLSFWAIKLKTPTIGIFIAASFNKHHVA